MEKRKRENSVLAGAAELFDLPADMVAGLPHVEVVGCDHFYLENHRGILAYGTEEIHVSGGAFVIQITGQGLELRAMTGLELLITGRIAGIQLA